MLTALKRKMASSPNASKRHLGASAYYKYFIGAFFAALWLAFFGSVMKTQHEGIEPPTVQEQPAQAVQPINTAKPSINSFPENPKEIARFVIPYPANATQTEKAYVDQQREDYIAVSWADPFYLSSEADIVSRANELFPNRANGHSNYILSHKRYLKRFSRDGELSYWTPEEGEQEPQSAAGFVIGEIAPLVLAAVLLAVWYYSQNTVLSFLAFGYSLIIYPVFFLGGFSLPEIATSAPETVNEALTLNAYRWKLLFWGFACIALWFFAGHKYAMFRRPSIYFKHIYLGSIVFFGLFFWSFVGTSENPAVLFGNAALLFIPPMLLVVFDTYRLVIWEWFKEWGEYREGFVLGKADGGGSGRWAGVRQMHDADCTDLVHKVRKRKPNNAKVSTAYLGMSDWKDDYQIKGRHIGLTNDKHLLVTAGTGGGKSKYVITNMLTVWNGGAAVFDVKGEHYRTTASHRKQFNPVYLIDPYGVSGADSVNWNPLAEIDAFSDDARTDLIRLSEAVVMIDKNSKNPHFSEIGQMLFAGLCAYVLTAKDRKGNPRYPAEKQNLGAVYDLWNFGRLEGEEPRLIPILDEEKNPVLKEDGTPKMRKQTEEEAIAQLLRDMKKCEGVNGLASEAATMLGSRIGPNERGSFITTMQRNLSWINDPTVRKVLTKGHDVSLRDIKSREAWVYFAVPEKALNQQMRFVRVFFQLANDLTDNYTTPKAANHDRQVLFLYEEFNKFGYFRVAEDMCNYARSSMKKAVFIIQNTNQLTDHYSNADNFFSNCDKLYFALARDDKEGLGRINEALGQQSLTSYQTESTYRGDNPVMQNEEIAELINENSNKMILIPKAGHPMRLKRVACYSNFPWTKH